MNDKEMKELEKLDEQQYKQYINQLKLIGVILILITIFISMIVFFNETTPDRNMWMIPDDECGKTVDQKYVDICGTLNIDNISFNYATVLSDGKLVCTFDNDKPTQIYNYETSSWDTNPNYKVCFKIFNYQGDWDNGFWKFGGQSC